IVGDLCTESINPFHIADDSLSNLRLQSHLFGRGFGFAGPFRDKLLQQRTHFRNRHGKMVPRTAHLGMLAPGWLRGPLKMLTAPESLPWPVGASAVRVFNCRARAS